MKEKKSIIVNSAKTRRCKKCKKVIGINRSAVCISLGSKEEIYCMECYDKLKENRR